MSQSRLTTLSARGNNGLLSGAESIVGLAQEAQGDGTHWAGPGAADRAGRQMPAERETASGLGEDRGSAEHRRRNPGWLWSAVWQGGINCHTECIGCRSRREGID